MDTKVTSIRIHISELFLAIPMSNLLFGICLFHRVPAVTFVADWTVVERVVCDFLFVFSKEKTSGALEYFI